MKVSSFALFLAIGILSGILTGKYMVIPLSLTVLVLLFSFIVSIKLSKTWVYVFFTLGVLIGTLRAAPLLNNYGNLALQYGESVVVEAEVIDDPVYHESGQYQFRAESYLVDNKSLKATFRIRSFSTDFSRGDTVKVEGKLRDGFAYWQGSMYYAQVDTLEKESSNISSFRSGFIAHIYSIVPDPEASLGLGFLIGIRSLLPEDLTSQLSTTGLTHIVAVSGYNLTILANASKRSLQRFSRFQAVIGSLGLIAVFVSITGFSPSILRALIVSSLSIGAWYYGRQFKPLVLLLYSSTISAYINPAYAWFDIGWYLSLSAFFGVLVIAPLIQKRLYKKDAEPKIFMQIIIETSSAQLLTMPIIILVFGEVSLIALLANALILPLIPLAMLATFGIGMIAFVSLEFAGLLAIPGYLLMRFIVNVIRILAEVDWALIELKTNLKGFVFMYVVISLLWLVIYKAVSKKESEYLDLVQ